MNTNKHIKLSTQCSKKNNIEKAKLDNIEKKRVNSKSKLGSEATRNIRTNSDAGKMNKSSSKGKLNKSSNNLCSSTNLINTQVYSSSKATEMRNALSRNERLEKKPKIDEYNQIIGQYLDNKNRIDLKEMYHNKDIINKSVNINHNRTEYKSNELNTSNLNSSAIFRTQNKSNASFLANITQSNDKSFCGNHDLSPLKKSIKTYKLNDLINSHFVIPGLDNEQIQKKEKFPVIEDLKKTNKKDISNNLSPLRTNEFTFDKTFGKNSDIQQKLLITKEPNKTKYINTKERNNSPFEDNRKNGKSPNRQHDTSNIINKYKEKISRHEQTNQIEHNYTNATRFRNNYKSSSKLDETKECNMEEKPNSSKTFSKHQNNQLNEHKKSNNILNQSVDLKFCEKKNIMTSNKDKRIRLKHNDTSKSRDHNNSILLNDKQPSPVTKSEVSNVSNKNSVFNSVNSGNYSHTKNSTNDTKSVFGVKVNDPESIEEMHYLYVKFHQKTKKMMNHQECNHNEKKKILMYQTVVEIEEVDIE